jgi:hypothetical protein
LRVARALLTSATTHTDEVRTERREAGQAFNYGPREPKGSFTAQRPELTQRIPVVMSGK